MHQEDPDEIPLSELLGNSGESVPRVVSVARQGGFGAPSVQVAKKSSSAALSEDELPLALLIGTEREKECSRRKGKVEPCRKAPKRKCERMKAEKHRKAKKLQATSTKHRAEDESIKWCSLEHNGVLFPPEYEPHGRPLLYDGCEIALPPEAEEVATFYASKLGTVYLEKETFRKNFFDDFRKTLPVDLRKRIVKLEHCDFSRIREYLDELKERKQSMPPSKRKELREAEAQRVAHYTVAIVDGRKEKVANYRVEPPGLFLGRGDHPLMGRVKRRIFPEDVTLNLGRDAPIPPCPFKGHDWGSIVHNQRVTWLACWRDPISDENKYVWLSASSHFKAMSDQEKFEKAQQLSKHITKIRNEYTKGLESADRHTQQRSVALYLIDKLALRVGNEKGEDEADTVGCCSLRVEHITLQEPNIVQLDFLGKDSMRYFNRVRVEALVFHRLREFLQGKRVSDNVFDELKVEELNDYLKSLMPGLSAKVFRTYNASYTLDKLLHSVKTPGPDIHSRLLFYNEANKDVAVLCNHQRSLPKTHSLMLERLRDKLEESRAYLEALKMARGKAQASPDSRAQVTRWRRPVVEIPEDCSLAERKRIREEAEKRPKEKQVVNMGLASITRGIAQTQEKIRRLEADLKTRDSLATVSLSTSKINYLDPRITVAWCKRHEVPIERIFPRALQEKFMWSMGVSEDFRFPISNVVSNDPSGTST